MLAGVLLLAAASPLTAQQQHFMREQVLRGSTPTEQALVERIRVDLAQVRLAQDAYFASHQGFAPELGDLKGLKLGSGAQVVVLMSGPRGWKAEATHPGVTGREVVHVMRLKEGERCPMMDHGGMEKGAGSGDPAGKNASPAASEHQH
jgi:hypothetical protein